MCALCQHIISMMPQGMSLEEKLQSKHSVTEDPVNSDKGYVNKRSEDNS